MILVNIGCSVSFSGTVNAARNFGFRVLLFGGASLGFFWSDFNIDRGIRRRVLGAVLLWSFWFRICEEVTGHLAMKDAGALVAKIFMHRCELTQQVYLTKCKLSKLQQDNPEDWTFGQHRRAFVCLS